MKRHYVFPAALATVLSVNLIALPSYVNAQDSDAYSEERQTSDDEQNAVRRDSDEQAENYPNDTFDDSEDVDPADDSASDSVDANDDSEDVDPGEDNND